MKANLIHRGNGDYRLFTEGVPYATTGDSPYKKLSKQNCDEIFGVVNVEKLAEECSIDYNGEVMDGSCSIYKEGFNKAMQLNKDKQFTLEDIEKAIEYGIQSVLQAVPGVTSTQSILDNFIQQPTTIEVEIVTEEFESYNEILDAVKKPILDSEGCLILKKIEQ